MAISFMNSSCSNVSSRQLFDRVLAAWFLWANTNARKLRLDNPKSNASSFEPFAGLDRADPQFRFLPPRRKFKRLYKYE